MCLFKIQKSLKRILNDFGQDLFHLLQSTFSMGVHEFELKIIHDLGMW